VNLASLRINLSGVLRTQLAESVPFQRCRGAHVAHLGSQRDNLAEPLLCCILLNGQLSCVLRSQISGFILHSIDVLKTMGQLQTQISGLHFKLLHARFACPAKLSVLTLHGREFAQEATKLHFVLPFQLLQLVTRRTQRCPQCSDLLRAWVNHLPSLEQLLKLADLCVSCIEI